MEWLATKKTSGGRITETNVVLHSASINYSTEEDSKTRVDLLAKADKIVSKPNVFAHVSFGTPAEFGCLTVNTELLIDDGQIPTDPMLPEVLHKNLMKCVITDENGVERNGNLSIECRMQVVRYDDGDMEIDDFVFISFIQHGDDTAFTVIRPDNSPVQVRCRESLKTCPQYRVSAKRFFMMEQDYEGSMSLHYPRLDFIDTYIPPPPGIRRPVAPPVEGRYRDRSQDSLADLDELPPAYPQFQRFNNSS